MCAVIVVRLDLHVKPGVGIARATTTTAIATATAGVKLSLTQFAAGFQSHKQRAV